MIKFMRFVDLIHHLSIRSASELDIGSMQGAAE